MAIKRAQGYLLRNQNTKGYWVGALEADASVAAGYIPLMFFMNGTVDPVKSAKVVEYVKTRQNDDGSWSTYAGGPGDLNVSVQVYFALKLAGRNLGEQMMAKARDFILAKGGLTKTNTITKIWLALFGQFDYRGTPSIPPEVALLPNWFYFNIYEFASWSRETIMALVLILNTRPVRRVPDGTDISELFVEADGKGRYTFPPINQFIGWKRFFMILDAGFKAIDRVPIKPFRRVAMARVEKWLVEHQEADGSWGGIMLPWIYALMALKSLGHGPNDAVIKKGMDGLQAFVVEDEKTLWLQPATSPVWDTAWTTLALMESGISAGNPAIGKGFDWLLGEEVKVKGDWQVKNPRTQPGGWAFEFDNDFYPDIDDTAVVTRALIMGRSDRSQWRAPVEGGLNWVKDMQCRNGGWAAFDRDNNKQILASVPFADFMTPLDPTSPDVTAHAVELLARTDPNSTALKRAVKYLRDSQEQDGAWYGRWGVNYLYGTGLVLVSLRAAGENQGSSYVRKAVDWLKAHQNADGGWGETCETYANPTCRGMGPSTASQTAWSLMGLIAVGEEASEAVQRGIEYLLPRQNADGSWDEEAFTGTGFPKAFYLRYDLYRVYFPLLALANYRSALGGKNG